MPDTAKPNGLRETKIPESEAADAKKAQEEAKPAQHAGSAARTHLRSARAPQPGGPAKSQGDLRGTPGTLPEDPTQATDPGAAKPGTPGVD